MFDNLTNKSRVKFNPTITKIKKEDASMETKKDISISALARGVAQGLTLEEAADVEGIPLTEAKRIEQTYLFMRLLAFYRGEKQ